MFRLIFVVILATAYGALYPNNRVVGGQSAARGQFPHQASLQYKSGGIVFEHECGAVIISENWALTAASCRDSFDLRRYRVVAGITKIGVNSDDVQIRQLEEFILHPKFNFASKANDIALILFTEPLSWTETVQPIAIPKGSLGDLSGSSVLASWGEGHDLEWVNLVVPSSNECESSIKKRFLRIDDAQICTAPGTEAACSNDRGSGLVQDKTVVGLVSWSPDFCGSSGSFVVYTRVDSHLDFIEKNVQDL